MVIKRIINGIEVEIELTNTELLNAYLEQENKFDIASCKNHLNSGIYDCEEWYENLNKEKESQLIEDAADYLRRNIDRYEMSYEYALEDAFVIAINDYFKEEE